MTNSIHNLSSKCVLLIMDGFGISSNRNKNAIHDAKTPNLDSMFANYPFITIEGGGELVGLPQGVMGNSEVGHMNLGAGRPVRQDLVRINEAIENQSLKKRQGILDIANHAKSNGNRLHIMGLLSDGGVHSHIEHLKELLKIFNTDFPEIEILFHAFMDGRDTNKKFGIKYIKELESSGDFKFASIQGRSIGMDRDRRWEKIQHAYRTFIGKGEVTDLSPVNYIESQYKNEIYDEFITPVLFSKDFALQNKEAMFFINFRPDRAKQISYALTDPNFSEFETPIRPGYYLCMTPYIDEDVDLPILFDKEKLKGTLGEYISSLGLKQYRIAETEKYAHVTYFFNGGESKPFPGETQKLVPSPRDVQTYDEKPEMSAEEVTSELLKELPKDYNLYVVNYANSDMVGHTGNYSAAVKAVESLDSFVNQIKEKCLELGIPLLITADHGNSDEMVYDDGSPHTSHTKAPVPFCFIHPSFQGKSLSLTKENDLALKDIAPTILNILGVDKPAMMTGESIFV